jgi:transmembrane sensor
MKEEKFWLLLSKKITGEATAEELKLLQQLVSANPEWTTTMENLQELWNSRPPASHPGHQQKNEDAYLSHISRLKEKVPDFKLNADFSTNEFEYVPLSLKRPFFKRWTTYAAATVLIGCVVMLFPLFYKGEAATAPTQQKAANEISINPGSRTKIQLPDGSAVWINSGSKLTYGDSFKGGDREVELDGEAYFDVVKDADHPFIVHTSGIDIKVLGTAFNVKAYRTDPLIEATLIHGSIEVINKNRPGTPTIMLKPLEKLVYNKYPVTDPRDQRAAVTIPDPDAYSITIKPLNKEIEENEIVETAWVYNKLAFEDEKFEDLLLKMERWYNLTIIIENEKLKNHRISGSFVDETAEEALKELQFLVPFRYSIKNREVRITKK